MNSKIESTFSCGKAKGLGFSPNSLISFFLGWGPLTRKNCQEEFDGHPSSEVANLSTTSINASCVCVLRLLWVKAAEFSQENWYPPRQCGNFQIKATKSVIQYQQDQESGQNQANPDWEGRKSMKVKLILIDHIYIFISLSLISFYVNHRSFCTLCIDTNDQDSWKG